MTAAQKLSDLEVIGYANVLKESMLPSIVAPIFRNRADPGAILLPPFSLGQGLVWNATESDAEDVRRLEASQEVTLLPNPFPALPEHELWVDQNWQVCYEPRTKVHEHLSSIARDHIQKAREAFAEGKLDEADRLSGTALAADDRIVDSLVIKAAICRCRNQKAQERVMARLASPKLTDDSFHHLVRNLIESGNGEKRRAGPSLGNGWPSQADLFSRRPMYGIARLRAAA